MAQGLILEFDEGGEAEYRAVSAHLGIDVETGTGDWPDGLLSHAAGTSSNGTWVVMEVWASARSRRRSWRAAWARRPRRRRGDGRPDGHLGGARRVPPARRLSRPAARPAASPPAPPAPGHDGLGRRSTRPETVSSATGTGCGGPEDCASPRRGGGTCPRSGSPRRETVPPRGSGFQWRRRAVHGGAGRIAVQRHEVVGRHRAGWRWNRCSRITSGTIPSSAWPASRTATGSAAPGA